MYISKQTLQDLHINALPKKEQDDYIQMLEEAIEWRVALDLLEVLDDDQRSRIHEYMKNEDTANLREFLKPLVKEHTDVVTNATHQVLYDLYKYDRELENASE